MMCGRDRRRVGPLLVGAVAALLLVLDGCSSSAKPGGGAPPSGGNGSTVQSRAGSMGTFLTDASGRSLYLFAADAGSKSTCSGACASVWPPLAVTGSPAAAGAVKSSLLGTITRSDGSKQITYAGHPLYTYASDSSPSQTNGEGSNSFGANWWLVAPSGQPITNASSSTSSSGSSSSGGTGGY